MFSTLPSTFNSNSTGHSPIIYKRKLLTFAEVWFDDRIKSLSADIVQYIATPQPPSGTIPHEVFHTLLISLNDKTESDLLNAMEKNTRYEIRRAEARDNLAYASYTPKSVAELNEFIACYEQNVAAQSAGPKLNLSRLSALINAGVLDVSVTRDSAGQPLTWHVHIMGGGIARLFLSAAIYSSSSSQHVKNLCGRANRLHHWIDIVRYRKEGIGCYDFGGYYTGIDDLKKIQINKFKAGFGGTVALTYNYLIPITLFGRIALMIRHLVSR